LIAIACKPLLLIADEPTTALDVTVQKEIIQLLKDIQQETGMSIILYLMIYHLFRDSASSFSDVPRRNC
jgi:ABC-type dipeptide/oligopeptide/nickel transport system ATPase component